jgi:beta-N-acetylhexosaminidase
MHTNPCEWSEERSAGQRLMAGFHGTRFSAELEHLVSGLRVGGLILFKRNVESPAQLAELCRAVQDCARGCGQPPLIVSIDQEGGPVARLGRPFTSSPATRRSRMRDRPRSSPTSAPGSFAGSGST